MNQFIVHVRLHELHSNHRSRKVRGSASQRETKRSKEKDPRTSPIQAVIERLIRLAPFLRIGMDNIRDMIGILLTEPRGATSSVSTGLQQQFRQNVEKESGKLSELFPDKNAR